MFKWSLVVPYQGWCILAWCCTLLPPEEGLVFHVEVMLAGGNVWVSYRLHKYPKSVPYEVAGTRMIGFAEVPAPSRTLRASAAVRAQRGGEGAKLLACPTCREFCALFFDR